ncbi:nucleotidyl transferase AbiEii/AbiGii toxin family protein [Streptomyces aurantiacus]|uniref:Nucleotidyl transferase AbiEii/AbiGii toxin family protein n=1 Tax=Streptomyces aurantiacus JA 4570 TaxID=1286094 RepID=S4A2Y6_9ACTN|nr:nucleotidyl transferase AbiEii/AbiGii toxin family protein [Streptomyces aurantiacus]EPH45060.1 hypothetical protein STRAU_1961 [Streptomyces aurantiacus JA 4570]
MWVRGTLVPHAEPGPETRRRRSLPSTLLPAPAGIEHPAVFDPALKQFANAYRAGEPRFHHPDAARAWHRARRTALDTVLAAIAGGPWAGHLVLRGSVLMATWCGDAARDPGDLDFVVVPRDLSLDDPRVATLFGDVARDAAAASAGGPVRIHAAGTVVEDIWTYDRVPGRRMLLPWTAAGTAGGTVQLDLVFNETMPVPAEHTRLRPLGDGPGSTVLAASPGLSLAWKLLWLTNDTHPQGKDLYDAVLLAEHTPLDYETVRAAFVHAGEDGLRPPGPGWAGELCQYVEWEHFAAEYAWVEPRSQPYEARLERALEPLVAEAVRPGETSYERWARWLEPLVESAGARAEADPERALTYLSDSGREGFVAAVVVLRETVGRASLSVDDAMTRVLAVTDAWRLWRENPESARAVLEQSLG